MIIRSVISAVLGAALNCFGFWCGGFGFDQRGEIAFGCFILSVMMAFVCALLAWALTPPKEDE